MLKTLHEQQLFAMADLDAIFTHFSPQAIEEFYQLYQLWSLQKKREQLISQINQLEQQIISNSVAFEAATPSPIALATLTQFRAVGVDDIDLLDRMLERGDEWLDRTLQLFERCERLDMLQGSITEWCIHALEGAYDWIESMGETNEQSASDDDATLVSMPTISTDQPLSEIASLPATTEADFLQKLMSEDGENTERIQAVPHVEPDIQPDSEATEDLQPAEPENTGEQIDSPDLVEVELAPSLDLASDSDEGALSDLDTIEVELTPSLDPASDSDEDALSDLDTIEVELAPSLDPASDSDEDALSDLDTPEMELTPSLDPASTSSADALAEHQLASVPTPPTNAVHKRASHIKRPLTTSSRRQKGKDKKHHFNQYKRRQKRSR